MAEFEIKGTTYRSGKMVGRTQIHVLRRASPIIKPLFTGLKGGLTPAIAADVIGGLSELEDDKLDYILDRALAVVQMKDGQGWPSIMASDGSRFMFDAIRNDGGLQLAICANVLYDNYYPLFLEAPSLFSGGANLLLST